MPDLNEVEPGEPPGGRLGTNRIQFNANDSRWSPSTGVAVAKDSFDEDPFPASWVQQGAGRVGGGLAEELRNHQVDSCRGSRDEAFHDDRRRSEE